MARVGCGHRHRLAVRETVVVEEGGDEPHAGAGDGRGHGAGGPGNGQAPDGIGWRTTRRGYRAHHGNPHLAVKSLLDELELRTAPVAVTGLGADQLSRRGRCAGRRSGAGLHPGGARAIPCGAQRH